MGAQKSITYGTYRINPSTLINAILLCLLNGLFMVAGIILNSVVIISLWRSSQLRKKVCYFTIFVLSCFDLAVVAIVQPLLILSTILLAMEIYHEKIENTRFYISVEMFSFSTFSLLTLIIERFLALTRPFFHQSVATKGKLTLFLALQITVAVAVMPLHFFSSFYLPFVFAVYLLSFWFVLAFLNYKVLSIVKSKRQDDLRVAPAGLTTGNQERRKRRKRNFKNISTCPLAVGCFFICSLPGIMFATWTFISKSPTSDVHLDLFFEIWASTFACMNSTFNCVIFFWKNSVLRSEGMKILKCLLRIERS